MSAPEPRSVLAGYLAPGRRGAPGATGVTLAERRSGVIDVAARRGQEAALGAALRRLAGIDLPAPGRASATDAIVALSTAPATALILGPPAPLAAIRNGIAVATAAIVDQSWGFTILRIAGAKAVATLSTGYRLDLDPRAFGAGRVARTIMAQTPVILYQIDEAPSFDLVVPAALARSFVDFTIGAAEQHGCEILPPL